ncbi:hypothetical protein D3C81_935990 [compost metagenome]
MPPSATDGVALRVRLVVSMVSVTLVTADEPSTFSSSKSPPVLPVIFALTLPASMYTSSPGAAMVTLPSVWPAAMVMVSPLLRVTFISVPAGLLSLAT